MLSKEELRLIKITRLVPILVLIISILAILFITEKNDQAFENNIKEMKEQSILERKEQIKNEVYRVHDFIKEESTQTISQIKKSIKGRTNEAYSIINSIYSKNQDKTPLQIKKMVIEALREIRFNDGRGYFFLYETNGTPLMIPTLTHLEGTNIWDLQDVKGSFIIRQVSNIATQKGEGFLTWWWNRPGISNVDKAFEKIGYVKYFKPYDWFVGTGEYVEDFESDLKVGLLRHIKNIKFNNDGYIFIINDQGNYLSHYLDDYVGKNSIDSVDINGVPITNEIIKLAKSGEGYLSYIESKRLSTDLPAEKIAFVKSYNDWGWTIGTEVYLSEINDAIQIKQDKLIKENKQKRYQIILIGLFICIPVFILSIILSNQIRSRFEDYKYNVELKSNELRSLNKHLEETVIIRTKKLENTIVDLKDTQDKLVETEKMASMMGLVSGVAHEMNTPLGIVITAISQIEDSNYKFLGLLKEKKLTKKELANFENFSQLSYELVNRNIRKAINLIESFKSLSPQTQGEDKSIFSISEPIQNVLLSNKALLDENSIKVSIDIPNNIKINSYFHMISDVFHQLIQNSIIHAFDKNDNNQIFISTSCSDNTITIQYQDNGQGISHENKDKIFEPFYTTKRNTNCTGLGMSILYNRVIHQLKGEIMYDLTTKEGFKVNITLPI